MRIRKISNDKIVVQLTDTDLEYFDLDFDEKAPQATDLHKFLFEVMELVQTETGFDPYHGGQVVVEATTSANGMSLIISKVHTNKKAVTREEFARVKRVKVKPAREKVLHDDISSLVSHPKRRKRTSESSVYIFENFQDFEEAVKVLDTFNFSLASLYREGERYALISTAFTLQERNIITEYAIQSVTNDIIANDIKEGWTLVVMGSEMHEMAENLKKIN